MHRPTVAWANVPWRSESEQNENSNNKNSEGHKYHRTLCLEYPSNLLSGKFTATNPNCHSADAEVTGPSSLIVMLPGNPGICYFYRETLSHLLMQIPSLAVVCPSLPGFSLPLEAKHHHRYHTVHHPHHHQEQNQNQNQQQHQNNNNNNNNINNNNNNNNNEDHHNNHHHHHNKKHDDDNKQHPQTVFLLKDTNQFLYNFVESFLIPIVTKYHIPLERVWICGHSIGSYFSLHVIDKFPQVFSRAVLLAPTIAQMQTSPNGVKLNTLIHVGKHFLPTFVGAVLTYVVSDNWCNFIVQMTLGHELHGSDANSIRHVLRNSNITRQLLSLASDELSVVNPLPEALLRRNEEKIVFFYAQEDGWVPSALRDEIKQKFPKCAKFFVSDDPSIVHAWCSRSYDKVAKFVVDCFREQVLSLPSSSSHNSNSSSSSSATAAASGGGGAGGDYESNDNNRKSPKKTTRRERGNEK